MSDAFDKKKMTEPVQRPTARDALIYAKPEHGLCTVVAKSVRLAGTPVVRFKCACGDLYVIGANRFSTEALRNVPEDAKL